MGLSERSYDGGDDVNIKTSIEQLQMVLTVNLSCKIRIIFGFDLKFWMARAYTASSSSHCSGDGT